MIDNLTNFEVLARDYKENGLYSVMGKALTYYRGIVKKCYNDEARSYDMELFKRQINAMIMSGIELQCVNKIGQSKVFCVGWKFTIDRSKRLIKYIAIEGESWDDCKNKSLFNLSKSNEIIERLRIANQIVGLDAIGSHIINKNDLGIRVSNYDPIMTNKKKHNNYQTFKDVRHYIENVKVMNVANGFIIKGLFDIIYDCDKYKPIKHTYNENNYIDQLTKELDDINYRLYSNKVDSIDEALIIAKRIQYVSKKRREAINKKKSNGYTGESYTYFVRVLKEEIGETISK